MPSPDHPQPTDRLSPKRVVAPKPKRRFPWKTIAAVCVVAILGFIIWRRHQKSGAKQNQTATARAGAFPVSVVLGKVQQKDVPVYLDGLGTVQAFNTVTVRSRVEGQLQKVAFTEG